MTSFIAQIANTLTKKPEYGILSSVLSISMSTMQVLQFLGVVFGLIIAVITAILKVIELRDKLRGKKETEPKKRSTSTRRTRDTK